LIRLRVLLKWILFAAVLGYVCLHGYRLWTRNDVRTSLNAASGAWLIGSSAVYILAWFPSIWFWRKLMHALGGRVTFRDAARAYYCGHLGKYIPGKAMVLVIRSAMVKDRGCPAQTAAITAAYETLTMMGTGLVVGVLLAPLREWVSSDKETWIAAIAVIAVAAALPFIARLLSWIAVKTTPEATRSGSEGLSIPTRLVAAGCAAFVLSWALQGLSLGMTLHAVAGVPLNIASWPMWTGAMALSTSLGFAVLFAPAGLGVREAILLGVLNGQPGIDAHAAVAATVLSRVVSFLSEIIISTVLFMTGGPKIERSSEAR
jgi:glycosyltransferase 2 family protein